MTTKQFIPAILLILLTAGTAPVMGEIRNLLFEHLGQRAVALIAGALLTIAAVIFGFTLLRIRTHRRWRYAGLILVAILLWIQAVGFSSSSAQVDVAEKIHIVQYGLLAYLLYRALAPLGGLASALLTILWVVIAGTLEESVQWFVQVRTGDIRDVWLNAFAGVCGWILALVLHPPERWTWTLDAKRVRWTCRSAALAVLAVGAFFNLAHLGYEIDDEEIGRFRSWFSQDELLEAAQDRTQRWAESPPRLSPWAKEDYFMTEASWHVNHRNASDANGPAFMAWQANRILEKYYAPFLDLHSFRTGDPHRYDPARVERLAERARGQGDPKTYLSPVLVERIYIWPSKTLFWSALLPLVVLLWFVPTLLKNRDSADASTP